MKEEKLLIGAEEISKLLDISESSAYNIVKKLNNELKQMNCITISGRTNRKYFFSKLYGYESKEKDA